MPQPEQSSDDLTWPLVGKFLMQGGILAIIWASIFIFGGAIWSITKIDGISFVDHFYNGFVFAKTFNFIALFFGMSSGMIAFTTIGGESKANLRIVGYIVSYLCIVIIFWKVGSFELRKPPNQIIETIKEFKWPFGKD